jgi:hypothetical protein
MFNTRKQKSESTKPTQIQTTLKVPERVPDNFYSTETWGHPLQGRFTQLHAGIDGVCGLGAYDSPTHNSQILATSFHALHTGFNRQPEARYSIH